MELVLRSDWWNHVRYHWVGLVNYGFESGKGYRGWVLDVDLELSYQLRRMFWPPGWY